MVSQSQKLPIRKQSRFALLSFGLMLLSFNFGCMPMARTVTSTGEMFLVNRTGKPVPGLPDYQVERQAAAEGNGTRLSRQLDQDIANGFAKMSAAAESRRESSPQSGQANSSGEEINNANAQQLLAEMLARTDDQFFHERLLELKKQVGNSKPEVPRQPTRFHSTRNNTVAERSTVENVGMNSNANSSVYSNEQSRPVQQAAAVSQSQRQRPTSLPANSLREIQLPGQEQKLADQRLSQHQVRNTVPQSASNSHSNSQSMEIEVVSSDGTTTTRRPATPSLTNSNPAVSPETIALREQLREANELNRQMLAATAAMMPNALTAGAGIGGSGMNGMNNMSSMLGATGLNLANLGGGMNTGGYSNPALMQLLQEKAEAAKQVSQSEYDSASQIPAFDLNSNRPVGSAVNSSSVAPASYSAAYSNQATVSPSVEPGQWKGDLTETIETLRASIPQIANQNERQTLEVYLRLLELISSNHDAAVRTIDSLPREMQEFWRHQIFALTQITKQSETSDAMFVNHSRQATKTLSHLREAMEALQSVAMLQLSNLTFCEAVRSFGDYDLATTTTVSPGDPLLVYCEVENYATRKSTGTSGGRYQARLIPSYAIYNEQNRLVYQEDYPSVEDACKTQRQDFFITLPLQVPENLPAGRYNLVVSVEDLEGSKHTTGSPLPFHVR